MNSKQLVSLFYQHLSVYAIAGTREQKLSAAINCRETALKLGIQNYDLVSIKELVSLVNEIAERNCCY